MTNLRGLLNEKHTYPADVVEHAYAGVPSPFSRRHHRVLNIDGEIVVDLFPGRKSRTVLSRLSFGGADKETEKEERRGS